MKGVLRFRLLGPFEAFRDDERIPADAFRTRHARCVLKLLLTEHDRPIPFGRIADAFWPDADPAAARNSLHVAVRTLRRVLEPGLARGSDSRFIVTVGETYRFVASECATDVDAFVSHRRAGLSRERRADVRTAIDSYRTAMALYRGEYVAEEADAEWVLATRERLREAYLDVADRLAALLANVGQATEAVAIIERALRADPLREDLYLRLMTVHAAAGRRAHALAAFERCRRIERAALGVEPGAELARARAELLAARTFPARAATDDHLALTPTTGFVGREHELAALREAWTRSAAEPGHVVFIAGDAGIGKTRLAQHFAERLGPDGQVLWLMAHESERDLALAPLMGSLASWLDGATTRQVERVGPSGPALAHVLPQVRGVWPDCPPAVAAPQQGQLLEALTAVMLVRKGQGRVLVVLDDAQWADEDTLLWLAYALRRFPAGALFVLLARAGEGRTAELGQLRSDARRRERLLDLELRPLSLGDVERLVDEATEGSPRSATIARRLHAATRGNALFVVETIHDLPRLALTDGEAPSIPNSVRDAILARVDRLPEAARDVLGAMAVVGAPCAAGVVASIAGRPTEEVIDALDVLLARRLVRVHDDAQGYAIEHPFVTSVVYEAMAPGRREERNRRAAAMLGSAGALVVRQRTKGISA